MQTHVNVDAYKQNYEMASSIFEKCADATAKTQTYLYVYSK